MSEQVDVNVDTSVMMRHLYRSVLPDEANTDVKFEHDQGCYMYFDHSDVFVVAAGKAVGEFNNLCNRRYDLYNKIVDYMASEQVEVFEYNSSKEDINLEGNDKEHVREVSMALATVESAAEQASILRRCYQQIGECQDIILSEEVDETKDRYQDDDLRRKLSTELDIGHDVEILVDAAHLSNEESIPVLAAVDSDITGPTEEGIISLMEEKLDPEIDLMIIDAEEVPPEDLPFATI